MTRVRVQVTPKPSVLDPQGAAVERSLQSLGHDVSDVRVGRIVELTVKGREAHDAVTQVEVMCADLLANPVIESWTVEALEPAAFTGIAT